jgi:hypothetical protein
MHYFDTAYLLHSASRINVRTNLVETCQVIDPQCHIHRVFIDELARQAPRHADIAEVIDDAAKEVDVFWKGHAGLSLSSM